MKIADTSFKKRLWHKCFPVNFVKFLRSLFLQNTSGRLLLYSEMVIVIFFEKREGTKQEGPYFEIGFEIPPTNRFGGRGRFYGEIVCFFLVT